MKIPSLRFTLHVLLVTAGLILKSQVTGENLLLELQKNPKKTAIPLYKTSEDSLYKLMRRNFRMLHVEPVHHTAQLDLDAQGNVTKATVICRFNNCNFHPDIANILINSRGWSPAKMKGKPVAVTAYTVNLVPPYDDAVGDISPPRAPQASKTEIYTLVEEPPTYPGGKDSMLIHSTFSLPAACLPDTAVKPCKVFLKFIVHEDGTCSDGVVLKGCKTCPDASKIALTHVSNMPKWNPGKMNGKPVKTYFNLPVTFRKKQ